MFLVNTFSFSTLGSDPPDCRHTGECRRLIRNQTMVIICDGCANAGDIFKTNFLYVYAMQHITGNKNLNQNLHHNYIFHQAGAMVNNNSLKHTIYGQTLVGTWPLHLQVYELAGNPAATTLLQRLCTKFVSVGICVHLWGLVQTWGEKTQCSEELRSGSEAGWQDLSPKVISRVEVWYWCWMRWPDPKGVK